MVFKENLGWEGVGTEIWHVGSRQSLKQKTNIWSNNMSNILHLEYKSWLLLLTCFLLVPFPMHKLI